MRDEIKRLEKVSSNLEPDELTRKNLLEAAWKYSNKFINNIATIPAFYQNEESLASLDETNVIEKKDISAVLNLLDNTVDKIGINPASGGHLGYIPGGGIYTAAIGDYLAAIFNRYSGLYFANPGAVRLENKLIRWACDIMGYPSSALGNITSGGSIANLIAITTARDYKEITPDKIRNSTIYYTKQTHHCVSKAIRIAGLSECPLRELDVDDQYKMDTDDLERQIQKDISNGLTPFYIASSCGSTNTGAVDNFDRIAEIADKYNIWHHVDAAYGGFFILVDELKGLFKGIEKADSIVLDPHKTLFLPYGCGLILIKDGNALFDSFHYMADYLQDAYDGTEDVSPADLSPELTKHFRGLRMWIPLQLHGIEPFIATLKEKWLLTKYFYKKVQELGFEVGPEPQLSVCIYRYTPSQGDPNTFNEDLVKAIQSDGTIFVSSTNINDLYWIRIAIVSFRTRLATIDSYLDILKSKVKELSE